MRFEKNKEELAVIANQNIKEEEFWLNKLSGDLVKTSFPYDHQETGKVSSKNSNEKFILRGEIFSKLMSLSRNSDHLLHMIMISVATALLRIYTGRKDILLGSPIYKQDVASEYINTVLTIRNYLELDITFKELLFQVKETIVKSAENQNYPLEILLEKLNLPFSEGETFPLFEIVLMVNSLHDSSDIKHIPVNMTFFFTRKKDSVECILEYNTILYLRETICRIIGHFKNLLEKVLQNINEKLSFIDILSEEEKERLIFVFNDTKTTYSKNKTVHQLFEEQVDRQPDAIAVRCDEKQFTYRRLNQKANQVAHFLRKKGISEDDLVGIMLDSLEEILPGILGILKSGGAYLPIDLSTPRERIVSLLDDAASPLILTDTASLSTYALSFTALKSTPPHSATPYCTDVRPQILDLDSFQVPDRSLVDFEKYNQYLGEAMVKNSISMQATRGCPYHCAYCHKIWPKSHVYRSAENIFEEVKLYYDMGVRRFAFIDDIFNLNSKNSLKFYELVIKNKLDIHIFYPNGIRGDILTRQYIDTMVEAGTINMAFALETASPRLQQLIGKNLNLDKFRENIHYTSTRYPQVMTELFTMHGFPSETETEAMMTLDFIKSVKWIHIPYVLILKIYPNTDMEKLALEHGVSPEAIKQSENLPYHQLPLTLPFEKSFTLKYQADFLNNYVLSKERLINVLPNQMKNFTPGEILMKYNDFLPYKAKDFDDLLHFFGITWEELGVTETLREDFMYVPDFNQKLQTHFPSQNPSSDALRILLIDLSQEFKADDLYFDNLVEPPLGLMYLLTHLNRQLGSKINGKIIKSGLDFDNYAQLKDILVDFKPEIIGLRTLTNTKDFAHKIVSIIKQWWQQVPIIAGGPYATSGYNSLLRDSNFDIVVIGEGEVTFAQLIKTFLENGKVIPEDKILKQIPGIAFIPTHERKKRHFNREIILLDQLPIESEPMFLKNPEQISNPESLVYAMYTSGSTGKSKAVLIQHKSVNRLVQNPNYIEFVKGDRLMQTGALDFDASTFEIWGALLNGLSLHLLPKEHLLDAKKLKETLIREGIGIIWMTSPLFNHLVDIDIEIFSTLHHLVVGGDALSPIHINKVRKKFPALTIINGYGPTENTTFSITYKIEQEFRSNIPIGKPISNSTAYILNKSNQLVPISVVGELWVGGDGLARGYLNQPELTNQRFCLRQTGGRFSRKLPPCTPRKSFLLENKQTNTDDNHNNSLNKKATSNEKFLAPVNIFNSGNKQTNTDDNHNNSLNEKTTSNEKFLALPFCKKVGRRRHLLYKTGDLARWLSDGNIEFIGRSDHQVKIRGFRVEPGEIESRLLLHKNIKEAIVLVTEDFGREKHLCAYIVPTNKKDSNEADIREYLTSVLPDYMIPSYFIFLEKIPLTPRGKVDRKAFPPLAVKGEGEKTAPQCKIEQTLAKIWAEVLGIKEEQIDIDANFFELGGHSLKATTMVFRTQKALKVDFTLAEIFNNPTIRELAHYIKGAREEHFGSISPSQKKDYYVLSSAQKRMYILQQMDINATAYNATFVLEVEGKLDKNRLNEAFVKLIERHETLRTSFEIPIDEPVQLIHENIEFAIQYYSLSTDFTEELIEERPSIDINHHQSDQKDFRPRTNEKELRIKEYIQSFIRPFDLAKPPLLRVGLIKTENERHILMVDIHHIISDGTSSGILVRDFITLYSGRELSALKLQYKDFSEWQISQKQSEKLKKQQEYWLKEYRKKVPSLNLPTDFPRKVGYSFAGEKIDFHLSKVESAKLKSLASSQDVTIYMLLSAGVRILLTKLTGNEDIVIGCPVEGRRHSGLYEIIGMFVNTLAIRNFTAGQKTFIEFLKEVKQKTLEAFDNQDYQFEELVEALKIERTLENNPIFDVLFTTQDLSGWKVENTNRETSQLKFKEYPHDYNKAKFDLMILSMEINDSIFFQFSFRTDLYKKSTMEKFADYLKEILVTVTMNPNIEISNIEIIRKEKRDKLIKKIVEGKDEVFKDDPRTPAILNADFDI